MPNCDRCSSYFPNSQIIDNVSRNLSKRRFCLKCSPFGSRNRRDLTICDINEHKCSKCGEIKSPENFYSKTDANCKYAECKTCISQRTRLRHRKIKQQAVEYKGGSCVKCGYNKSISALDFHHRDPSKKEFGINRGQGRSFETIKHELDKCDLLCANCHREIHESE